MRLRRILAMIAYAFVMAGVGAYVLWIVALRISEGALGSAFTGLFYFTVTVGSGAFLLRVAWRGSR